MLDATIAIVAEEDVVAARQRGREIARVLGLGTADQTRLATAISELTRNAFQHAGGGRCMITGRQEGALLEITVVVEDDGPGIPDIAVAMRDGFSTGGGLGAGLPGTRRLMTEMTVSSTSSGARVTATMVRSAPAP